MKKALTKAVKATSPRTEYIAWDKKQAGLGIRVRPTGKKTYVVFRRLEGKLRKRTLGDVNTLSINDARLKASLFINGPRLKQEAKPTLTTVMCFEEFVVDQYWPFIKTKWKPRTIASSDSYVKSQLLPSFGKMRLDEINKQSVLRWFNSYSQLSPGGANRALEILAASFVKANEWGLMHGNPALNIRKNRKKKMIRFLSREEIKRVGKVLVKLEQQAGEPIQAANVIRLLLLTGCRHTEITTLK